MVRQEATNVPRSKAELSFWQKGAMGLANIVGIKSVSMYEHIEQYAKRDIIYESDALNAILGILTAFESETTGNVWGLPVANSAQPFDIKNSSENDDGRHARTNFCHSLAWRGTLRRNAGRRVNFPSWSWIGITAPVAFDILRVPHDYDAEVYASFECESGGLVTLGDYIGLPVQARPRLSRFMRLTGFAVDICSEAERDAGILGDQVALISNDLQFTGEFCLDAPSRTVFGENHPSARNLLLSSDCKAVIVRLQQQDWYQKYLSLFMIVLASRGDYYKRIGYIDKVIDWAPFTHRHYFYVDYPLQFFQRRQSFRIG